MELDIDADYAPPAPPPVPGTAYVVEEPPLSPSHVFTATSPHSLLEATPEFTMRPRSRPIVRPLPIRQPLSPVSTCYPQASFALAG